MAGELIRVTAVIATETLSGPGRQLAALAPALADRGVDVTILVLKRNAGPAPYVAHLEHHEVKHCVIRDRGVLDWIMVRSISRIIRESRTDVLQTHGYKATALVWVLRRFTRIPWIAFYHGATDKGLKDRLYQWLELLLLPAADRVVVVSSRQQRLIPPRARDVAVMDNAVIPVAVGDGISREPEIKRLGDAPRPIIAVVGRLSYEKGVDLFLQACAILKHSLPTFTAAIAGEGCEGQRLRELTEDLGLNDHVRFLGHVSDVAALYSLSDIVVIPSRSEGLPNVLLEAVARNVPVVATDVGAVTEVLGVTEAGNVVPAGDIAALADGIIACLRAGHSEAADMARAAVAERYSLDRRVDRHVSMYGQLLAQRALQD